MKIILPSAEIVSYTPDLTRNLEAAGRVCYKSEDKISEGSDEKFIEHLMGLHHESVIEHGAITVKFICDRGVSHELVRHRIASFSQESTRYCNYSKGKFGNELTVIKPCFWEENTIPYTIWRDSIERIEQGYLSLVEAGATAQQARSILPNSLKTEVVVTANPREWRHIFKMRTSKAAHPQMQEITIPLLHEFQQKWPYLYNDIKEMQ
jgi:thymidylate synthase (FAD)